MTNNKLSFITFFIFIIFSHNGTYPQQVSCQAQEYISPHSLVDLSLAVINEYQVVIPNETKKLVAELQANFDAMIEVQIGSLEHIAKCHQRNHKLFLTMLFRPAIFVYHLNRAEETEALDLLKKGVISKFSFGHHGDPALSLALARGLSKVTARLIALGADVNEMNKQNQSPLARYLIEFGPEVDGKVVKMLLDKGANLASLDYQVIEARKVPHNVVEMLVKHRSDWISERDVLKQMKHSQPILMDQQEGMGDGFGNFIEQQNSASAARHELLASLLSVKAQQSQLESPIVPKGMFALESSPRIVCPILWK